MAAVRVNVAGHDSLVRWEIISPEHGAAIRSYDRAVGGNRVLTAPRFDRYAMARIAGYHDHECPAIVGEPPGIDFGERLLIHGAPPFRRQAPLVARVAIHGPT